MSVSYSDFFDLRKDWVPPGKPEPVSQKQFREQIEQVKEQTSLQTATSKNRIPDRASATAYVVAYRQQEDLEYRQCRGGIVSSYASQVSTATSLMDDISESTSVADIEDIEASLNETVFGEDELKVYTQYDFTCKKPAVQRLTIFQHKDEILSAIAANQVVIIEGFTGCGKTTQVPQYILDDCQQRNVFCDIAVTQPRRVAAISIAERVCDERQWDIGKLVGYQVALDRCASEDTRLMYMTTGVILEYLVKRKDFGKLTHLIIDEVHERDKDTDFLMIVVKMLLKTNSKVKIILMSATINADQFAHYFTLPNRQGNFDEPPVISVSVPSSSNFPVMKYYLDDLANANRSKNSRLAHPDILDKVLLDNPTIIHEQYELAANIVLMLDHLEKTSPTSSKKEHIVAGAAVLIFLPGIFEIQTMEKYLEEAWEARSRRQEITELTRLEILPLHSTITAMEQKRAFKPVAAGKRKVILSTNIAESSVTVPDIVYVIDFCLSKQLQTDMESNYCSLKMEWASLSALQQRLGRCGRVTSGRVYRMIPKLFVEEKQLPLETKPELLRCPLEQSILRAKELDMGRPEKILALALDPPSVTNIRACILSLKEVGAMLLTSKGEINPDDGDLTVVGRIMGRLPLDIRLSKLITLGFVFNVLEECIIMAAGLSSKSIFSYPYRARTQAYCSKYKWAAETSSDPLAILNAYTDWEQRTIENEFSRSGGSYNREMKYCAEKYLQLKQLREMKNLVIDLKKRLEQFNIKAGRPPSDFQWGKYEKPLILKIVLAGACYPYFFLGGQTQNSEIWDEARKELNGRDPKTSVLFQGFPLDQSPYGDIYIQKIRELLRTTRLLEDDEKGALEKVDIHFIRGSSKFVVDFKETAGVSPEVSSVNYYVRKAVKMRQVRVPFPLDIKGKSEEAAKLYTNWQNDNEQLKQRMAEGVEDQVLYTSLLPQLPLPYITKSEMTFSVAHIETPGSFYLNYQEGEHAQNLARVYRALNPAVKRNFIRLKRTPVVGQLVIAPYSGEYFRAKVDSVPKSLNEGSPVAVTFIDYGNKEWKHPKDLYAVDEELRKNQLFAIPALALKCALAEVKPSFRESTVWATRTEGRQSDQKNPSDVMADVMSKHQNFRATVFSVVEGVARMYIPLPPQMASAYNCRTVNSYLVEKNLASSYKENTASLQNYEYRQIASRMPAHEIDRVQQEQYGAVSGFRGPITDLGACSERINLIGPRSAIEARVTSLASRGNKTVVVDSESVNSVLFEEQSEQPTERLLVATHLSMTQDGKRLTARNTTILPAVPGLWAIVTLLFAPVIELRTDAKQSRFTGAICGLGYNPNTDRSDAIFPDHDLELAFDVQISNEDIRMIDKIRFRMNSALEEESGSKGLLAYRRADLHKCHSEIATYFFGNQRDQTVVRARVSPYLLNSERKSIVIDRCRTPGRWNILNPENVLVASKAGSERNTVIFPLHNGFELTVFAKGPRDLMAKQAALQNLIEHLELGVPGGMQSFRCPLCDYVANTYGDISSHVRSREHQEMEIVFKNL